MERSNYLIDTNIAIYYFGKILPKESELFIEKIFHETYYISVINRIELLGFKDIDDTEKINGLKIIKISPFINEKEE